MNVTSANPGPDAYLKQLKAFDNWLHKYTDIPVVYPHGLSLFRFKHKDSFAIPEKAWKPLMAPNLIVEILIPIFQGAQTLKTHSYINYYIYHTIHHMSKVLYHF